MGTSLRSALLSSLLLGLALSPSLISQTDPVPVVVAVDTSRSLTPSQLRATTETLVETLASLPGNTPTGLIGFDDSPRWVRPVGSSPDEVLNALGELSPQGNFTLLHDAIFLALREMPDGGVILLATDGRDENSATTIEDVAMRCNDQGVRLVTVGSGGRLDERTLRRLALLTTGAYAGRAGSDTASQVGSQIASIGSEIRAARPEPSAGPPAIPDEPSLAEPAPLEEAKDQAAEGSGAQAATESSFPMSWLFGLGLLALVVIAFFLRSRPAQKPDAFCDHCGSEVGADGFCSHCADAKIMDELQQVIPAHPGELREVTTETEAFNPLSFDESIEKTRVLEEQTVLVVREPGQGPRTYAIPLGMAISIGRESGSNTLAIPDPTLSTKHFRIVPRQGVIYLLDLGSTNGCVLNGERKKVGILRPGDVMKAGQIEFAVKTRQHQLAGELETAAIQVDI